MQLDYVIKRLAAFVLVIMVAVSINFIVPRLIPGEPIQEALSASGRRGSITRIDLTPLIEAYNKKFGLDQPYWKQYLRYWGDLARGDLGFSISKYPARNADIILRAVPWTIGLLTVSSLMAFGLGTLLGAMLAWPRTPGVLANAFIPLSMIFSAIPYYLLGILLLFLPVSHLQHISQRGRP